MRLGVAKGQSSERARRTSRSWCRPRSRPRPAVPRRGLSPTGASGRRERERAAGEVSARAPVICLITGGYPFCDGMGRGMVSKATHVQLPHYSVAVRLVGCTVFRDGRGRLLHPPKTHTEARGREETAHMTSSCKTPGHSLTCHGLPASSVGLCRSTVRTRQQGKERDGGGEAEGGEETEETEKQQGK